MSTFKFGMQYWKRYIPLSVLAKLFSLIAIVCSLALPLLDAGIIDYILAYDPASPPEGGLLSALFTGPLGQPRTWELFWNISLIFIGVFLCRVLFLYLKNITFQWCGLRMECDMREKTYRKLLSLDSETLSRYNMGELLTTMNRDTIIFKELYARMLMNLFDSFLMIGISVAVLASFNVLLLIIPLAIAPFFAVALIRYLSRSRRLFRAIRAAYSETDLDVQENIAAVRIVRSFGQEEQELKKFDKCNGHIFELNTAEVRLSAKYNSIFTFFEQIGYVGTVILSILLMLSGQLYLGSLAAATTYVTKIISHITQLSRTFFRMQNQLVSGGRLKAFLSEESAVPDCPSALVMAKTPHIELKNVFLTIGDKQVLKDISLDIPYGKKVGIMGGTGSGKSALLKVLCRTFDVTAGSITVDGKDVREYPLEELRKEYAYVFQDVFLFSNTVDANIAFSRPECEAEEVFSAAETAQAARFVEKLPEGYETIVGERGVGLSGGQKQRLSIARAVLKGAPVLILDDASSALDMATEVRVLAAIKARCPEETLLIAAHRVSSVMDCDEVIFLRDGEIAERGTPKELIAKNGAFAAIYHMQAVDGQLDDSSYGKEAV